MAEEAEQVVEEQPLKEGYAYIYTVSGEIKGELELPAVFSTVIRPDLIKRDFVASHSNRRQPYSPKFRAGMRHSVETWGKGRGVARIQRIKGQSMGAQSPNNVGGRRAHPPRVEKSWQIKINEKERRIAKNSSIASAAVPSLVRGRGHRFDEEISVPVIVEDEAEAISRAADVEQMFGKIGVLDDVIRARDGKHIRAGRGKMRNRRYRQPTGPLVVLSSRDQPLCRSARNFPGVEVCVPSDLSTERLAPGGSPGRLVVFSQKAIEMLRGD